MTHYELLAVLPGTLTEDEVKPAMAALETLLGAVGAKNVAITDMGKNRLAYPIRHIRYGYFQVCRFEAEPSAIAPLREKLRLMNQFLRASVQKYDVETQTDPSIKYMVPRGANKPATGGRPAPQQGADLTLPQMEQAPKAKAPAAAAPKKEEKPVSLEDIDKKLDAILDSDIASV